MSEQLKALYIRLIINQIHEVDHWYIPFKLFAKDVLVFSEELKNREIDPVDDSDLLWKLLYRMDNGVSSRGQSNPGEAAIERLIASPEFREALRSFLLKPDKEHFDPMVETWQRISQKNNPVLWNRVAAARTQAVSTTVGQSKFNQVFYWLQKQKLIDPYAQGDDSWFEKNLYLIEQFHSVFQEELKDGSVESGYDPYLISMFVWYLYENIGNQFTLKKQLVKYGPPGTGKTYLAHQEAKQAFEVWQSSYDTDGRFKFEDHYQLIQFHPSFGYEDFIEGMRPKLIDGQAQLCLRNGIFKSFCMRAARWEIDLHPILTEGKTVADLTVAEVYSLKKNHPEVFGGDYWDYLWKLDSDILDELTLEEVLPPHFFVIDEINRAELSRVFGELMICLEYRGSKGLGLIQTQYAGLNDAKTGMIEQGIHYQFFVPHNLYLLGTMNSIDRSVESFDFALRRRFRWELVLPDPGLVTYHWEQSHKDWSGLGDSLKSLNQQISDHEQLGEDYRIGHAYLMNLRYPHHLSCKEVKKRIWHDSLRPLLHEYLRGTGSEEEALNQLAKAFGAN
jgi:5-methylcytosine-specific restriction protein B